MTHHSQEAPILYVAISQWMEIGDRDIKNYGIFKLILGVFAWCLLTLSLGAHAAKRSSKKNHLYPALVHPTGMLLTANWWAISMLLAHRR